jgi:hypothetical protein
MNILNFPTTYSGSITNFPTTYSGSITNTVITSGCVTNFPASYAISGSVAIQQDVRIDTKNTQLSGSVLAIGEIWSGSATSTLGVAGIQVTLHTDQNCTLYVDQSPDGNNWDISYAYNYYTGINNFAITAQAVNSYVRVRLKNIGSNSTTYFRLQTALCPIVEALPASLSADGNLKVAVEKMTDQYGFGVEFTPNDEMRIAPVVRLAGATFSGSTLDSNYWITGSGTGTISASGAQAILSSGSSANGSTSLQSLRVARYVGGSSNRCRIVLRLPDTGIVNNTRAWGCFSQQDGAFFELSGSTISVVTRKGQSDTRVSNGSFNGDIGTTILVPTDVKTWEIYWNNSKVYFTMSGMLLHTVEANSNTWSNTLHLPIRAEDMNSSSASSVVTMNIRAASIHRLGNLLTQPTSSYTSGTNAGKLLKIGSGNLHSAIIGSQATTSVVTLYDGVNTSGSVIFSYTYTQGTQANNQPFNLDFKGLPFFTGLFLVIGTANSNVLVIYE